MSVQARYVLGLINSFVFGLLIGGVTAFYSVQDGGKGNLLKLLSLAPMPIENIND